MNRPAFVRRSDSAVAKAPSRSAKNRAPTILPAVLLFYSTLVPPEVNFDLGTVRFFPYRMLLLLLLPWIVSRILSGQIRFRLVEMAVIAAGLWGCIAFLVREGWAAMEAGGAIALDVAAAYLIGRCCFQSVGALQRFVVAAMPGTLAVGLVMAFESLSHQLIVRPLARSLFGGIYEAGAAMRVEFRNGLLRAPGPFPHPILGGLQMGSLLPLFLLVSSKPYVRVLGTIGALCGGFALSSAALMSLSLGLMLVSYEMISKRVGLVTWKLFLTIAGLAALFIQLFSQSGLIRVIIRYLTFDPQTGYWRLMIWRWGGDTVDNNPWFGIGYADWIRPEGMHSASVDAHWLYLAMRDGLPAPLLLGAATIGAVTLVARRVLGNLSPEARGGYVAIGISVATVGLLMFTVTCWATTNVWFCLLLGAATGMARSTEVRDKSRLQRRVRRRPGAPPGRAGRGPLWATQ